MRVYPIRPIASRAVACATALALVSPAAFAQDSNGTIVAAAEPGDVAPLAAVGAPDEEESCKLITANRGEGAELVEERTREWGERFAFLKSQDVLLEEFRVDEETWQACGAIFGLSSAGGGAAAAGAAAGAGLGGTLAGVGVGATVGSVVGLTAIGIVAATVAAGGGGGPTPATSTVDAPSPE